MGSCWRQRLCDDDADSRTPLTRISIMMVMMMRARMKMRLNEHEDGYEECNGRNDSVML